MATHASWKGHLKISLASIPVQAYTSNAGSSSTEIALHQLHQSCKSRIQYKKFCPLHGEVSKDEIVSGFEYAHGQYAILDSEELSALSADLEKSLTIDTFVKADAVDALYSAGQTYYLVPDGRAGDQPYALIHRVLNDENLHGIGEVVMAKKQHLVRLRALERLLVFDLLHYEGEIRLPDQFKDEVRTAPVKLSELRLAKSLIEQLTTEHFDITKYADDYMERMKELIQSKLKGKKLPVPETSDEPDIINFIDALKQSVKVATTAPAARKKSTAKAAAPAAKKKSAALPSAAKKTRARPKRKTG